MAKRSTSTPASGAVIGAENATRVRAYLDGLAAKGQPLPAREGKLNVSAVAVAAGVDRQVLYKNPAAKAAIEEAASRLGLDAIEARPEAAVRDQRDQRIQRLEQENAALRAEAIELRRRVRQLQHVEDMMIETGRRVAR